MSLVYQMPCAFDVAESVCMITTFYINAKIMQNAQF
jgi:hypothetical protein